MYSSKYALLNAEITSTKQMVKDNIDIDNEHQKQRGYWRAQRTEDITNINFEVNFS